MRSIAVGLLMLLFLLQFAEGWQPIRLRPEESHYILTRSEAATKFDVIQTTGARSASSDAIHATRIAPPAPVQLRQYNSLHMRPLIMSVCPAWTLPAIVVPRNPLLLLTDGLVFQ